jgi:O-antigen ligase
MAISTLFILVCFALGVWIASLATGETMLAALSGLAIFFFIMISIFKDDVNND